MPQEKNELLEPLLESLAQWRSRKAHSSEMMPEELWELVIQAVEGGVEAEELCHLTGLKLKRLLRKLKGPGVQWDDVVSRKEWEESVKSLRTEDVDPRIREMRKLIMFFKQEEERDRNFEESKQYDLFHSFPKRSDEELLFEIRENVKRITSCKEINE